MKKQQFELAELEYDSEENILYYRVKQDQIVDVNEIKEMLKYVQEFMGEYRHSAIIDFGGNLLSTEDARKIYADSSYIQKFRIADAFIVKSLAVRIVANFFINVTKPKVKTKLFTDERLAKNWLMKQNKLVNT